MFGKCRSLLFCLMFLSACAYRDAELDRDISVYRGAGIQKDGDRMPRRTPSDIDSGP